MSCCCNCTVYQRVLDIMKKNEINVKKSRLLVSVVIPTYKDEKYINKTLKDVKSVLEKMGFDYEIIVVVDGLIDGTFNIVSELSKRLKKIKTVAYKVNRGKGYALRQGFSLAKGDLIGFIDADGQIKAQAIESALKKLTNSDADMVIGSKKHLLSKVVYSTERRILSKMSQFFIKLLFNVGVSDTQAGLKMFKRKVIGEIGPRLTVDRFAIDIEILSVAKFMGYKNIEEIPIEVKSVDHGGQKIIQTISFVDLFKTFSDSLKIFYQLRIDKFYSLNNKDKWIKLDKPDHSPR